jgi:hypothetical protein
LVLESLEGRWVPSTVTNLNDAGAGSLRQAIIDTSAGGTVDFQDGLSGTITLTTGELAINKSLTIAGLGSNVITVSGGGVWRVFDVRLAYVDISGLTIANGSPHDLGGGGGIYNSGHLIIAESTLSGNIVRSTGISAAIGGGILNDGTLTVTNCALSGNSAESGGTRATDGGGIYNSGTAAIISSTLSGNSASGGQAAIGGGIDNIGTLTITESTFVGNSAHSTLGSYGGAIANGSTLTLINSTLSGNSATSSSGSSSNGGGISNAGTLTVTNSTLSANFVQGPDSSVGGGIDIAAGTVTSANTIVAANSAPSSPDVAGALTSQGYNLIGDATGGSGYVDTDLVGTADMPVDPMLGPLQDNGGPSQTMALLGGSPALNAGDPAQLGVPDQRGVLRSGSVNIGAYQASATAFLLAAPDTVSSGVPFDMTVTGVDPYGQVAVGYTGTVTFSTTDLDPGVVLPADYTFTPDDQGVHTFTDTGLGEITLITPGVQMLTATDTTDNTITGSTAVTVTSPDTPDAGRPTSSPVESAREPRTSGMASSALDLAFTALHQKETNGTVW